MNGKIYKVSPTITKEEILSGCVFEPIPDYGDVMEYKEFIDLVNDFSIIDYDGTGRVILFGQVVKYASTWLNKRSVFFADRFFVPFDVLHSLFGSDLKIIWFNK